MRLAMYGPICHTGGSSAMALFQVVEEWLRAGIEIDFYSPGTWIDPAGLVAWPGFRYVAVEMSAQKQIVKRTYRAVLESNRGPKAIRTALAIGLHQANRVAHEADLAARIRSEHATRHYDAYVSINRTSSDALSDAMPVLSWTQGPPGGESDFIRREPAIVRGECGWQGWAALRGGYMVKDRLDAASFRRSTGFIVASEWARTMWIRAGVPAERLAVIPFPVELDRFRVAPRPVDPGRFTFLWLGRIVPRKRLPLALEALARLRERRPGAHLVIVGGNGYPGIVSSYRLPPFGAGVERLGTLSSDEIPALLAKTDVIFQPSENENFGAAPVEGLASGIPSVVGPTNGTADCLLDTAFRFETYEPGAIAEAMERAMDAVLSDPAGVAQRARAVAEKTLALPTIARQGAEVIRQVIARWHGRSVKPSRRAARGGLATLAGERASR